MGVGNAGRIDPWSSEQSTDYARIRDQFGLESLDLTQVPIPVCYIVGVLFSHIEISMWSLDAWSARTRLVY